MVHTIAERVTRLREARGWQQAELARRSGLSVALISHLENGRRPNPTLETLRALATAFGLPIGALLADDGDEHAA